MAQECLCGFGQGYSVFGFPSEFLTPAIYSRPVGAVSNQCRIPHAYSAWVRNRTYRPGVLTSSKPK